MSYRQIALAAALATSFAAAPAIAQVGGGSIGGSGTIGGSGSVGGAQVGGGSSGGSSIVQPGNQNPGPGSPVLPGASGSSGGADFSVLPGTADPNTPQGSPTTGTQGIDRAPTASTTPPSSIIDQPTPPTIPGPDQPGGDPATINLQQGQGAGGTTGTGAGLPDTGAPAQ